jgi:hypothetical protein
MTQKVQPAPSGYAPIGAPLRRNVGRKKRMTNRSEKAYCVHPSVIAPIILAIAFTVLGITKDHWLLLAVPFAILGTFCSAPNMNLADGFLVLISTIVGFALAAWVMKPLGTAIVTGSVSGWILGAMEKRIRMTPIDESEEKENAQPGP